MRKIAVIGAGMAGLACARTLVDATSSQTLSVTVFDKSRGVGGRMATRRVENYAFDHGAQYFTARGEGFLSFVTAAQSRGSAAPWSASDRFIGTPAMSSLARDLAFGLTLQTNHEVKRLTRDADGWMVQGGGEADGFEQGPFDDVVLAMPAPQIAAVLKTSGLVLPGVESARYAPCWALLLGFANAPTHSETLRFEAGPIRWVALNSSKAERLASPHCVVVHASPEWSREHLERSAEFVREALIAAYQTATGQTATPDYAAAHRWRYALVEQAVGQAFLHDAALRLGACGDWCLGPRVECAYDSGVAMAHAFLMTEVLA